MKKILFAVLMTASFCAMAGNCDYPDEHAADGSICGARAASVRAGGYTPPPEYSVLSVDNDLTPVNTDKLIPNQIGGDSHLVAGENTYPDNVEFKCNGDLNISFNAGRYSSSIEKSEVPENWYSVELVAHNHYLGNMEHSIFPNNTDAFPVNYHFDHNDTGYLTISNFPHVWEFATLKVNYVNGKAVSASLKGTGDFNYQCKRINVENPWKA
ncbi:MULTISPECIES: hypothetical protein [Leclercia]|uniref:hypothetical protein n=1 Tax=Leclercia TaxID=83654 RepID=UPI001E5ED635|nr:MULTISPECIES: hypothetical protein [Leclercia]